MLMQVLSKGLSSINKFMHMDINAELEIVCPSSQKQRYFNDFQSNL